MLEFRTNSTFSALFIGNIAVNMCLCDQPLLLALYVAQVIIDAVLALWAISYWYNYTPELCD